MKNSIKLLRRSLPHKRKVLYPLWHLVTALVAAVAVLSAQPNAMAQSDNYDSGTTTNSPSDFWVKGSLEFLVPGLVTTTFPNEGIYAGNKGLRLQVNPIPTAAPGVAFWYRTNIYTDFYVQVDLAQWPGTDLNQAVLLTARGNTVDDPRTFTGYIINYDASQYGQSTNSRRSGQFQLSVVTGGFGTYQLGIAETTLVRGGKYRFVIKGVDSEGLTSLSARAYDWEDLTRPVVELRGEDSLYTSGVCGIGNFSRVSGGTPAFAQPPYGIANTDCTFDNYNAVVSDYNTDIEPAIRHPNAGTPQVVTRTPASRFTNFYPPASGISFNARTFTSAQILASATKLYLNGVDVSTSLAPLPANGNNVNFSTGTSPLQANKVYSVRIELEADNGLKGTNTFWLDTFSDAFISSAPCKTIECEDYNYQNGQWQADPIPVSGFNTNGIQVNGAGVGYLDLAGVEGVDFHDNRTTIESPFNNYRINDVVGQLQGAQEVQDVNFPTVDTGYYDSNNGARSNDNTRQKYVVQGMKEYQIVRTETGEWLNYTRSFSDTNYLVYLRASSFGGTTVSFDKVTSDPTLPGQTTSPLGKFYVPNLFMRSNYRYIPLTSESGVPVTVNLAGTSTVRLTMERMQGLTDQENAQDARKIYMNYLLFVPVAPPVLQSSATVNGLYTDAPGQSVNTTTKTITVPRSGDTQFYRLRSDIGTTIQTITVVGPNVVITYN